MGNSSTEEHEHEAKEELVEEPQEMKCNLDGNVDRGVK
jgi:hypothetical protein